MALPFCHSLFHTVTVKLDTCSSTIVLNQLVVIHAFNKGMRLRDSTCELRVQLPTTEVYLIYLLVAGKDLNHKRLGEYLHDLKL